MPDCRIDHLHVARKNLLRGTMFRLAGDCYRRSVVCARRLLCTWKVRSNSLSYARLNFVSCASDIYFDRPRKLGAGQRRQAYKRDLLANPGNCGKRQEVGTVSEVLNPSLIFDDYPEHATARWSNVADVACDASGSPCALTRRSYECARCHQTPFKT
jgi:hypothetical protein